MDVRSCLPVVFRAASALLLASLAGCADGPFNGGGTLNPWLRKEWERDERRGPTFHTQMKELRELADAAGYQPAERQQAIARDVQERYRNEANPLLRTALVKVAGNVNAAAAEETLTAAMNDTDPDVRAAAVRGWGRRGGQPSLQVLASALADETDSDVRIAIAAELRRFQGSSEATQALALALDDTDAALQHQAIQSLEEITGHSYGMSVPAWREHLAGGNPAPVPGPSLAERVRNWVWW